MNIHVNDHRKCTILVMQTMSILSYKLAYSLQCCDCFSSNKNVKKKKIYTFLLYWCFIVQLCIMSPNLIHSIRGPPNVTHVITGTGRWPPDVRHSVTYHSVFSPGVCGP